MDSLDLLVDIAGAQKDDQRAHFDALDAKAGITLGFAGTLIALLPDVSLTMRFATLVLLVAAAAMSAAAFWPRKLPALDANALREYLRAEADFTKLTLYDTYVLMISEGSVTLGRKVRFLKAAMAFLAAAGGTLAIALMIGGGRG